MNFNQKKKIADAIYINASSVSNCKLARTWFLIKFCLRKPLSHTALLKELLPLPTKVCVGLANWSTPHESWLHSLMPPIEVCVVFLPM